MTKLTPNRHLKNDYNPARATGKAFEHRMPILNPPHLRKKSELHIVFNQQYRLNNAYMQTTNSGALQVCITYISPGSHEIKLTTVKNY